MDYKLLVEFNACHAKFHNSDEFLEALGVDVTRYMFNREELCGIGGDTNLQERLLKGKDLLDLLGGDFCRDFLINADLKEMVDYDGVLDTLMSKEFAHFLRSNESGLHNLYWDLGFELFDSQRFKDVVYVVPLDDISPVLLADDWYNEKNFSSVNVYYGMTLIYASMLCYTPEKICDEHVDYVLGKVTTRKAESVLVEKNDYLTKHGFSFKKYKIL